MNMGAPSRCPTVRLSGHPWHSDSTCAAVAGSGGLGWAFLVLLPGRIGCGRAFPALFAGSLYRAFGLALGRGLLLLGLPFGAVLRALRLAFLIGRAFGLHGPFFLLFTFGRGRAFGGFRLCLGLLRLGLLCGFLRLWRSDGFGGLCRFGLRLRRRFGGVLDRGGRFWFGRRLGRLRGGLRFLYRRFGCFGGRFLDRGFGGVRCSLGRGFSRRFGLGFGGLFLGRRNGRLFPLGWCALGLGHWRHQQRQAGHDGSGVVDHAAHGNSLPWNGFIC